MENLSFASMTQIQQKNAWVDEFPSSQSGCLLLPQSEFEGTILEDLKLLDIRGDLVTHTSDHFDTLYEYAVKFIKDGNAYADDTEQQQVSSYQLLASLYFIFI